jgi:transposase-like protein
MSVTPRRRFEDHEKVAMLRQHLLEKVPISDLCDQHGIQPNQFYNWQKIFFENGASAFARNGKHASKVESIKDQKIAALQAKLQRKDGVIAELMEDHVALKKSLGEV